DRLSFHHLDLRSSPTRRSSDLSIPTSSIRRSRGGSSACVKNPAITMVYAHGLENSLAPVGVGGVRASDAVTDARRHHMAQPKTRSQEHTSELQSRENLVCRLLL